MTYAVVVGGTVVVWDLMDVHDQDGGGAMALGLVIGPAAAMLGGAISAVVALIWAASGRQGVPPDSMATKRRDRHVLLVAGAAIAGGIAGHIVARFVIEVVYRLGLPVRLAHLAYTWLPTACLLLGAVAGGVLVHRRLRR